jgi:hypothetical protein
VNDADPVGRELLGHRQRARLRVVVDHQHRRVADLTCLLQHGGDRAAKALGPQVGEDGDDDGQGAS